LRVAGDPGHAQAEQRGEHDQGKRHEVPAPAIFLRRRIASGERLAQSVERHREDDDGDPRLETTADVQSTQRRQHVVAEPASADHRGDDDHVQG
jgi:hypothetical protein